MSDLGHGWSCYFLTTFHVKFRYFVFFSYAVLITVLFGNNWREPILVKFRPIINQILEVSEVNQKIDIKMWFLHEWFDERLVWNPLEYGNITVLHIPADKVRTFSTFRVRSIKGLITEVASIVTKHKVTKTYWMFSYGCPMSPFITMPTVTLSSLKWFAPRSTTMAP